MGDGWKKVTRRVRRIFGGKDKDEVQPKKLTASQIIRPEEIVPQNGKTAPPSTRRTRRTTNDQKAESTERWSVTETPWGVTHIAFRHPPSTRAPKQQSTNGNSIPVRDPVTRRLSRKKLNEGFKKTTGFYNPDGTLISEEEDIW